MFDVSAEGDIVVADPDESILSAEFVPVADAIERLRQFPINVMVESAIAYCRGSKNAGAFWSYGDVGDRR